MAAAPPATSHQAADPPTPPPPLQGFRRKMFGSEPAVQVLARGRMVDTPQRLAAKMLKNCGMFLWQVRGGAGRQAGRRCCRGGSRCRVGGCVQGTEGRCTSMQPQRAPCQHQLASTPALSRTGSTPCSEPGSRHCIFRSPCPPRASTTPAHYSLPSSPHRQTLITLVHTSWQAQPRQLLQPDDSTQAAH